MGSLYSPGEFEIALEDGLAVVRLVGDHDMATTRMLLDRLGELVNSGNRTRDEITERQAVGRRRDYRPAAERCRGSRPGRCHSKSGPKARRRIARVRGAEIVVVDETAARGLRRMIEGDVDHELRGALTRRGVGVEMVPFDWLPPRRIRSNTSICRRRGGNHVACHDTPGGHDDSSALSNSNSCQSVTSAIGKPRKPAPSAAAMNSASCSRDSNGPITTRRPGQPRC
jgi:hypothetical protein